MLLRGHTHHGAALESYATMLRGTTGENAIVVYAARPFS
jgi:hypothetical protein